MVNRSAMGRGKEGEVDIVRVFKRCVSRHGDRIFAFDSNEAVTYEEAEERSNLIASQLITEGICSGETIALASPDSVALLLMIIGAWKAGALPALIDARTPQEKLSYFVEDIGAKLVVAVAHLHDNLKQAGANQVRGFGDLIVSSNAEEVNLHSSESPLFLSYTSGTTGPPKGVVIESGPVTLGTNCIADRLQLTRDDVLLATTPTSSSFQLVAAIMPALHVGATVGLVAGNTVDKIWQIARKWDATVLIAYPLTLSDIVNTPHAVGGQSSLRVALSGGSPLAPRIKRDYLERLGIPLLESYGQSELGGFMVMGAPNDKQVRSLNGFVGRPLPDRLAYIGGPGCEEISSGEVGEVMVPHGFFAEYRNKLEKTLEAKRGNVLHTGDMGIADHDGYIKVLGRVEEAESAERRGGFLRELEDVLYEHPAVKHAAVVEGRDGNVRAFAEALDNQQITAAKLKTFVSDKVIPSMSPHEIRILDAMPRSFSGKADRFLLSQQI